MHDKQDFCLTAQLLESDNGEARFVFDEPVSIKANSKIVVYWANVQHDEPQTGYLQRGYRIYVNLPVHTMQNDTNQDTTAYKRNVFLNIPPQNEAERDVADPTPALTDISSITYEPFNPRVLNMKNQEQQITSLTFQIVDLFSGLPNGADIGFATRLTVAFCIQESCGENNMY